MMIDNKRKNYYGFRAFMLFGYACLQWRGRVNQMTLGFGKGPPWWGYNWAIAKGVVYMREWYVGPVWLHWTVPSMAEWIAVTTTPTKAQRGPRSGYAARRDD